LPAIGPGLRPCLRAVFGLFALLCVDSVYLSAISALEAATGEVYQNWFYLLAFAAHLGLGILLIVPAAVFSAVHLARTRHRRNRRAVRAGYGLLAAVVVLLLSGLALVRVDGLSLPLDTAGRRVVYWLHALVPLLVIGLFVLHRLAPGRA
jgi:ABC-type multidrug transport system fused ATPase/permease subunit